MSYTDNQKIALKAILGEDKVQDNIDTPDADKNAINDNQSDNEDDKDKIDTSSESSSNLDKAKPDVPSVNDETILAYLKEKGIEASSIEDLKPKKAVDPEVEAEQKEAEKLAFALKKGIYSKKDYESFIKDTNNPKGLVYESFAKNAKSESPELTDEQIEEQFDEIFSLNADPSSFKYKAGVKNLAIVADKMLQDKYNKIYTADKEFENYHLAQKNKAEFEQKILKTAPVYKNDVEAVCAELSKIKTKFSSGTEYEVEILQDSLNKIKSDYLSEKAAIANIEDGYTKEELKSAIWRDFLVQNFEILTEEIAKQHLKKNQAGSRGIPEISATKKIETSNLTDRQEFAIKAIAPNYEPVGN